MAVNFALFIRHQVQVLSDLSSVWVLPTCPEKGQEHGRGKNP